MKNLKEKLVISENQLDLLKVIYAAMIGAKYYTLKSKYLFGNKEIDPHWWQLRNVLGHYTPKQFIKELPPSKEWGWYSKGFLKFRKTKKGAIVYIELATLRQI